MVGESRSEVRESALHCKNEYGDMRAELPDRYPPEGISDRIYHIIPNFKLWLEDAKPFLSPWWREDELERYQGRGSSVLREISFDVRENGVNSWNSFYDIKESFDKRFYVSKTEYVEEYQDIIDKVRDTKSTQVHRNWTEIDRETLNVYYKNWETGEIREKWACSIILPDQLASHFDEHWNKLQSFVTKEYEEQEEKRQEQLRKNKI